MDRIFLEGKCGSVAISKEQEKWQEVALVDISYYVLDQASKTMNYGEIFKEAARLKGLTDEQLMELIPQVYTEMNLDGRFICISAGQWGLKKWYTTESIEESIEALARSKGIDDDDDDYGFEDDEVADDDFSDDIDFDSVDDDADEEEEEEDVEDEDLDFDEDVEDEEAAFEEELEDDEFTEEDEDADGDLDEEDDL